MYEIVNEPNLIIAFENYLNLVYLVCTLNEAIISAPAILILAIGPGFAKAIKN